MERGILSVQRLTKGTLQTLQKLEETAAKLNDSEENHSKQRHQLAALQKAVESLRVKRDQLKKDLQNTPWKVLRSTAIEEKDGKLCVSASSDWAQTQDVGLQGALHAATKVKAEHLLTHTSRLTGCTVTSVMKGNRKQIRICWDTFTDGQYCEPYYMEVETRRGGDGSLSITRHSLPYFVPLDDLSEDLNNDIAVFVQHVRDYLNAFVCRRQQAFELQNKHHQVIDGEVHTSAPFDNLTFDLKLTHRNETVTTSVGVVYDDLLSTLPSRVFVGIKDGELSRSASLKLCNHLKTQIRSHPLHTAVESMV